MPENYIHIFTVFIGELVRDERITLEDAQRILTAFLPVCESVTTRAQLIAFIDTYIPVYWELKELKEKLLDSYYIFTI